MADHEGPATGPASRALVLGGGGVTGIAWETGFLAGMIELGLDPLGADLVVGTSAGATVAAQVTSGIGIDVLMASQLDPGGSVEPAPTVDLRSVLDEIDELLASSDDPFKARRRVGRYALTSDVPTEAYRLDIIRRRLPRHEWPSARLILTAVDAGTGALVEIDRTSGLALVDAVAASCAIPGVWPAVTDGARRLMDGGIRTGSNADLAVGHDRVLVLEPFGRSSLPSDFVPLPRESVLVIEPDPEYREVAPNALDPSSRPQAAEIGRAHARREFALIEQFWRAGPPTNTTSAPAGAITKGPGTPRW
ncbi:patatin-like phospholipase family protein [Aeromicrobium sp. Leaf350]|uniref:patatin-like phospholipase family protein n=1 Tax=Aeromicrobium sp. Leaf350 TaxID=2876565 RepID=UPI00210241AD|nr:patatin-like phospholipase family protein [Aeromicrobium sp. Leaf350]